MAISPCGRTASLTAAKSRRRLEQHSATLTDYVGQAILVVIANHHHIFFCCIAFFLLSLRSLMSFYARGKNGFFGVVDSVLCPCIRYAVVGTK
jgi:hypothetical protein